MVEAPGRRDAQRHGILCRVVYNRGNGVAWRMVEAMFELPLFPLNTVLFPGMPLHLHIFEERYQQMIGRCLQTHEPFGVVLIEEGVEALGPLAKPHRIGCTARIVQTDPLDDGRMNILAVGEERFRILALDDSHPYLVGQVEPYPLANQHPPTLTQTARRLRALVRRYLDALAEADLIEFETGQLPQDPLALAYLAATILQVAPAQKQALLTADSASRFLADLYALYRHELALLAALLANPDEDALEVGPFTLN